ncbi:Ubiquitin carboxyl-terminal hydrolase 49, partial [Eschrichtius robustus]|nr:Ubiquitin carboxyl-terminal hydrolase 49 [Eschrichtius robustus]
MDRCKHVGRLRLAQDHSILNPQKWCCRECATTESVWACLKCSHVACGRYIEDHALKHFEKTGHPLAMEVRDLYVFCYLCKDYVLNDNPEGDLKLLRSSLLAVRGQTQDPPLRRGRTLRSMASGEDAVPPQRAPQGQPQMLTALWYRRQRLLARTLRLWFEKTSRGQAKLEQRRRQEALERKKEAARQRRREVTCVSCNYKSNTIEPFWDLSLEFPERYHCIEKGFIPLNQTQCLLTEMLAKFTETEALEGRIYACDQCNSKRRKSNPKPLVLSEARKQLMIYRLPQVLRLHLKRFRWSGRNHREKIGVHVVFDQVLTMEPYCCRDMLSSLDKETFAYDLSAVVMHHGKGFGSGHYTAYCYNTEGGFWVHCNDSKLNVCSVEEVCKTQAYILFYTQRTVQGNARISETQLQTQVQSSNNDEGRPRTFP